MVSLRVRMLYPPSAPLRKRARRAGARAPALRSAGRTRTAGSERSAISFRRLGLLRGRYDVKALAREVLVEGNGRDDAEPLHQDERRAIGEAVLLVISF